MNNFVVIPAHNEGSKIASVLAQVKKHADNIIVVDDGSYTPIKVSGAKVIRHIVNRGKGAAVKTGIAAALLLGGDYLITLDGDGQHDSADIAKIVEPTKIVFELSLSVRSLINATSLAVVLDIFPRTDNFSS